MPTGNAKRLRTAGLWFDCLTSSKERVSQFCVALG